MAWYKGLTSSDKPFDIRLLQKDDKLGRGLLGDLCGTNYAAKGSVWHYGLGGSRGATPDSSNMGVFTNDYKDSITVVWSHTLQFQTLTDGLSGNRKLFDYLWFFADDPNSNYTRAYYAKASSLCRIVRLIDKLSMRTTGSGWAEEAANAFKNKITWLLQSIDDTRKASNRKPAKILVVLHRDKVWNAESIAYEAAKYIEIAASIVTYAIPAIPKDIVQKSVRVLTSLRDNGQVNTGLLIDAATSLVPDSLRQNEYVQKAQKVYDYAKNRRYDLAAKEVGIDVPSALESFKRTCDWTIVAKNAKIGFDGAIGTLQNTINADVISKFSAKMRSGTFISEIIDTGTITDFKEFQDAILGGMSPQAVMTLLPNPTVLVQKILQETDDVQNTDEFRAFLGLANGIGVGDNVLDELGIRSISSRVNAILADRMQSGNKDKEYALTTAIDKDKREYIAQEVSKATGSVILTNPKGVMTSSNIRKAAPYIAVGGAALGIAYFYNRK